MAMELMIPTSKFGSVRQLGVIAFFVLMLVGIWSKKINPTIDIVAVISSILVAGFGALSLANTVNKWKELPMLSETEKLTKIIVFYSVFMLTLKISDYQIACYTIATVVIGFRFISSLVKS